MKRIYKISIGIIVILTVVYFCLPYYAQQALIHWFPDIDDLTLFEKHTVVKSDSCWEWTTAHDYNDYQLEKEDDVYLVNIKRFRFSSFRTIVSCMRSIGMVGTIR